MVDFLGRVRGWQILLMMAAILFVGSLVPGLSVGLIGGLVLALYVCWLSAASIALRRFGTGRWRSRVPESVGGVAVLFALFAYPFVWDQPAGASGAVGVWRVASAVAIFVLVDHVAIGLARRFSQGTRRFAQGEGGRGTFVEIAAYIGLAALCLTPIAIPVLHGRIFGPGRPPTNESIGRPSPQPPV